MLRLSLALLVAFASGGLRPPLAAAADPVVVGHRGLPTHVPEQTPAAFRACLDLRVGVELDVRRTRDGQLVCLHDATLDRTTDGKGKLADVSLRELKQLDAGVRADIDAILLRLQKRQPTVERTASRVYDEYLRANRVADGTASYSRALSLILSAPIRDALASYTVTDKEHKAGESASPGGVKH